MSQENIQLHRRAMDAYNSRDIEAFIEYCHPQIEFHSVLANGTLTPTLIPAFARPYGR